MGRMDRAKVFSVTVRAGGDPGPAMLDALTFARAFLGESAGEGPGAAKLLIVVEELVGNVLRHGATGAPITVQLELSRTSSGIALRLEDDGQPFDPVAARPTGDGATIVAGGVGLQLVREWASDMDYRRDGACNRLHLNLS